MFVFESVLWVKEKTVVDRTMMMMLLMLMEAAVVMPDHCADRRASSSSGTSASASRIPAFGICILDNAAGTASVRDTSEVCSACTVRSLRGRSPCCLHTEPSGCGIAAFAIRLMTGLPLWAKRLGFGVHNTGWNHKELVEDNHQDDSGQRSERRQRWLLVMCGWRIEEWRLHWKVFVLMRALNSKYCTGLFPGLAAAFHILG